MPRTDEQIIAEARKRFQSCVEAESDQRQKALDDLKFLNGEQWTPQAIAQRSRDNRPALVVNRLDQFVQHISNAMRQNRVSARVFPVDDDADVDTAEVIQGILRHIENESKGTLPYDTAGFYAVAIGFGYYGLTTEYCDPKSNKLDIKLRRFANPLNVYLGPHTLPDGSDAPYGFIATDMLRDDYDAEFPDSDAADIKDWSSIGDGEGWFEEDQIRVAEYYVIEYEKDTVITLEDGTDVLESEMPKGAKPSLDDDGEPVQRETRIPTCCWYKINGREVLDRTVWPIPAVPIFKVTGNELNVNGKTELKGIIRNLKDAQRDFNYMLSAQVEAIDSSKGQVVIAEGQDEGHEREWQELSRSRTLRYKPTTHEGQLVERPNRLPPNLSVQAMNEARSMAADDLKALTGIYDAALGQRSNETSGRGILARQQQTDTANFHFQDNLALTISTSTRMMVDLIGKVYDTPRVERMIGEDETQKVVKVNQRFKDKDGKEKFYDLTVGKYDVICTSGPSFQSKRQEGAQLFTQLMTGPFGKLIAQAAPDLVMKMYDIPYAPEMAERLVKILPPGLVPQEGQQDIPPAVAQKMQQLQQLVQQLSQELEARTEQAKVEQIKMDTQLQMKRIDSDTKLAVAEIETKAQAALERAKALWQLQRDFADAANEGAGQALDHQHEVAMSQLGAQQAQQQAEQQQQQDQTQNQQ